MSKSVVEEVAIGAALVGAAFVTGGGSLLGASALTSALASSGAGFVLSGVGTLLNQKATGIATTSRNAISPWQVIYGRTKVGGTIVYQEEVADNNRILLLVVAVAAHPCDTIEELWINNRRINTFVMDQFSDPSNPNGFFSSIVPAQAICKIQSITRIDDVVEVVFDQNASAIIDFDGETMSIRDTIDSEGGDTFNGFFPVTQSGPNSFTYLCGGTAQGPGAPNTGTLKTTWQNCGNGNVEWGLYLGDQTTASGIIVGNTAGFWTNQHLLKGRTYVAIKLTYDSNIFNGLPEISFVVRGKNDIFDPRTNTRGYTNNAALCIADYLNHPLFGFSANYGTEIPTDMLIAAANVCDEQVQLALGGTESRYTCNGAFDVSVKRGEVLQNLLTSCAGRLTYVGGQFNIQPAAWTGPVTDVNADGSSGANMLMSADGLVVHSFSDLAVGRQAFIPDSCGTVADQFLFALGMFNAHQATGNNTALALGNRALAPILPTIYQGRTIPSIVDATHSFAPHWLYNVKQPFTSAVVRYTDQFQFGDGSCIVPDIFGEVKFVFQAITVGAELVFQSPFSPVKTGTAFQVASYAFEAGVGTRVNLTTPFNGTLQVIYSVLDGDTIFPGELFQNTPDWRPLNATETDTYGDSLNWAYRLFSAAGQTLEGEVSPPGYGLGPYGIDPYGDSTNSVSATGTNQFSQMAQATLEQTAIAWDIDDSRDWMKPSTILEPFSQAGTSLSGTASPDVTCDDAGNIVLSFNGGGAAGTSATYMAVFSDVYNPGDTTFITLGTDTPVELTIFIDTADQTVFNPANRYTQTIFPQGIGPELFIRVRQVFFNADGVILAPGSPVTAFGIIDANPTIVHTLTISRVRQTPDTAIRFGGGMVPMNINFAGQPSNLIGWEGPIYVGQQSPWMFKQTGSESSVNSNVLFLQAAQAAFAAAMLKPDTVRFVITGANPQTINVPVAINASGSGSCSLTYTGANVGVDTVEAHLDSESLFSNNADVEWSNLPNGIALNGDVQVRVMSSNGTGFFSSGPESVIAGEVTVNSLMFNTHPQSLFPGDPHESGNQANPVVNNAQNANGTYAGDVDIPASHEPADMAFTGAFIVSQAGEINFTSVFNSAFVMAVEGASYVSGPQFFGTVTVAPFTQLAPLVGFNGGGSVFNGGNFQTEGFTLSFPKPGIYPFEIDWSSGLFDEKEFVLLANNAVIRQVGTPPAASGSAGTGSLILTPISNGQWTGEPITLNLAISGVSVPAVDNGPFVPIFYPEREDVVSYGPKDTFGYNGPDAFGTSVTYQLRPVAETAELISICNGSEQYFANAESVVNTSLGWFDNNWPSTAIPAGPPTLFVATGPTVTYPDPQAVALLLRSLLFMDGVTRPNGNASGQMNATYASLLSKAMTFYGHWFQTSGPMAGTFCNDGSTWFGFWHGELLRSLSQLFTWASSAKINDPAVAAQALVWIDGLINFANLNVQVVDSDLGYTVADLAGGIRWQPKLGRVNLFNGIKGTYRTQAAHWQQTDFPSYAQDELHGYINGSPSFDFDANWEADGQRLWKDIQLPFTTSCATAQRIAKIELLRIRQQGRGTLTGMMSFYQSTALDIIYFSYAPFGWSNKLLEIGTHRLTFDKVGSGDGEVTLIGTQVDVQETDSSVYDWSVVEELSPYGQSYIASLENLAPED